MTSLRMALLLGCGLLASTQLAAACPRSPDGIYAAELTEGMPDERGLIDGKPNTNGVRTGQDILFVARCEGLCGREVKMELKDQATQTEVPVTFEQIEPSYYWRVRPMQPLAAGTYLLTYTGTILEKNFIEVAHYAFRVEGDANVGAPQLQVSSDKTPFFEETGSKFNCGRTSDCPFETYQFTQSKPYVSIRGQAVVDPLPEEQKSLFLFRLLPAGDPSAEQSRRWESYLIFSSASPERQYLHAPESCWLTQALRFSTGEITTSAVQCVAFNEDLAEAYPGSSKPCKGTDATKYMLAWCEDNRTACAADNPRAATMELQKACATYADACGPLLGKRAVDLGTCAP